MIDGLHRARPRRLARRPLVDRRRADLRRHRRDVRLPLRLRLAARDAQRQEPASCARPCRRSNGAKTSAGTPVHVAGRERRDEPGERLLERLRPVGERRALWNTLLDGRFTPGEVQRRRRPRARPRRAPPRAQGHRRGRRSSSLPISWLVTVIARRRGGIANPGALPFALLALTVLGLLAAPIENVVSRRYEAEADWSALQGDARSGLGAQAVRRLPADEPAASRTRRRWDYLWLETHPTIAQRIAMVEAWAQAVTLVLRRRSPAGSGSPRWSSTSTTSPPSRRAGRA